MLIILINAHLVLSCDKHCVGCAYRTVHKAETVLGTQRTRSFSKDVSSKGTQKLFKHRDCSRQHWGIFPQVCSELPSSRGKCWILESNPEGNTQFISRLFMSSLAPTQPCPVSNLTNLADPSRLKPFAIFFSDMFSEVSLSEIHCVMRCSLLY